MESNFTAISEDRNSDTAAIEESNDHDFQDHPDWRVIESPQPDECGNECPQPNDLPQHGKRFILFSNRRR